MEFRQFLERYGEFNTNNVIVCDIQPMYSKYIGFSVYQFADFLKQMINKGRNILYLYNGENTVGEDTKEDIIRWLVDALYEGEGKDDDYDELDTIYTAFMRKIIWHDKGYNYLRPWMDEGVSNATIIKTIRYMANKHINDSRNLEEDELEYLTQGENIPQNDPIFIPPIPLNTLKQFNGAFICGGGKHECLKEVQLLMNAFNIKHTMMSQFIF